MTFEEWTAVVEPKVQGAWNLHEAITTKLDFFILFSSYSGIVGQWGQANYAAANTFLDAFVQYRHNNGLAASVIDVGVMGQVGYVSKTRNILDMFQRSGMRVLEERDLLDAVNLAIHKSSPTKGDAVDGSYQNPGQILLGLVTSIPMASPDNRVVWKNDIRMSIYHNINCVADASTQGSAEQDSVGKLLSEASSSPSVLEEDGTIDVISRAIATALAKFLIKDESSMKIDLSPEKNGVDSLVAMELRNWMRQKFNVETSVMVIMQSASLAALADFIRQGLMNRFAQA